MGFIRRWKAEWCGNMLGRYREREIVKKEWFGTPKKAAFENEEVNIPENSDAILKCLYIRMEQMSLNERFTKKKM